MSPGGLENPPSVNPTQNEDISARGYGVAHAMNFKALFLEGITGYGYVLRGAMRTVS
jgi:hypothetical protein